MSQDVKYSIRNGIIIARYAVRWVDLLGLSLYEVV